MTFRPLEGKVVVDVTSSLAGPYCTQLLAALGADVIKVEPPEGDHARAWGPPFVGDDGALWFAANAGKRSVTVDLDRDRDRVLELVDDADVFVQSLRPGLAEKHELDSVSLRARKPSLVHVSIGAYAGRPGYDPLVQAATGIMSVTGEADGPPVRAGVSLIDFATGQWAAIGVLALDDDPQFRTNPDRVRNRDALRAAIEGALAARPLEEWEQLLVDAGVPAARVRTVAEAMADEHTQALGILQKLGAGVTVAPPLKIDGARPFYPSPPPAR